MIQKMIYHRRHLFNIAAERYSVECCATQRVGSTGNDIVEQLDISAFRYVVENLERVINEAPKTNTGVLAMEICKTDIDSLVK